MAWGGAEGKDGVGLFVWLAQGNNSHPTLGSEGGEHGKVLGALLGVGQKGDLEGIMELPDPDDSETWAISIDPQVGDVAFFAGGSQGFERSLDLELLENAADLQKVEIDLLATNGAESLEEVGLDEVESVA